MSKPKKPRVRAAVDVPAVVSDAFVEAYKTVVSEETHDAFVEVAKQQVDAMTRDMEEITKSLLGVTDPLAASFDHARTILSEPPPVERLDLLHATRTETIDLTPIHAAAERAGLQVTSLAVGDAGFEVRCGQWVPPFVGATVAEVVAAIDAYNCKHCGTGGGHHPNCGRPT